MCICPFSSTQPQPQPQPLSRKKTHQGRRDGLNRLESHGVEQDARVSLSHHAKQSSEIKFYSNSPFAVAVLVSAGARKSDLGKYNPAHAFVSISDEDRRRLCDLATNGLDIYKQTNPVLQFNPKLQTPNQVHFKERVAPQGVPQANADGQTKEESQWIRCRECLQCS